MDDSVTTSSLFVWGSCNRIRLAIIAVQAMWWDISSSTFLISVIPYRMLPYATFTLATYSDDLNHFVNPSLMVKDWALHVQFYTKSLLPKSRQRSRWVKWYCHCPRWVPVIDSWHFARWKIGLWIQVRDLWNMLQFSLFSPRLRSLPVSIRCGPWRKWRFGSNVYASE